VISRISNLTGWLFQAITASGIKNAKRCPKKRKSSPQWKGTEPQNKCLPSRNWDEMEEILYFDTR
jgi:hypothetical protein